MPLPDHEICGGVQCACVRACTCVCALQHMHGVLVLYVELYAFVASELQQQQLLSRSACLLLLPPFGFATAPQPWHRSRVTAPLSGLGGYMFQRLKGMLTVSARLPDSSVGRSWLEVPALWYMSVITVWVCVSAGIWVVTLASTFPRGPSARLLHPAVPVCSPVCCPYKWMHHFLCWACLHVLSTRQHAEH
jgi:hypothetical protein